MSRLHCSRLVLAEVGGQVCVHVTRASVTGALAGPSNPPITSIVCSHILASASAFVSTWVPDVGYWICLNHHSTYPPPLSTSLLVSFAVHIVSCSSLHCCPQVRNCQSVWCVYKRVDCEVQFLSSKCACARRCARTPEHSTAVLVRLHGRQAPRRQQRSHELRLQA